MVMYESSLLAATGNPYNPTGHHGAMLSLKTPNPYSTIPSFGFSQGYIPPGNYATPLMASSGTSAHTPFPNFGSSLFPLASMTEAPPPRSENIKLDIPRKSSTDIPLVSGHQREGTSTPSDTMSPMPFSPSPSGSDESVYEMISEMIPTSSHSRQSSAPNLSVISTVTTAAPGSKSSHIDIKSVASSSASPVVTSCSPPWSAFSSQKPACPNVTLGSPFFSADMSAAAAFQGMQPGFPWAAQSFYPWAPSGTTAADFAWLNNQPLFQTKASHGPLKEGRTRTREKYRMVYTDHQRFELEKEFQYNPYITSQRKNELSTSMGLSERQIKIWFQNRRAKERKQGKKSSAGSDSASIAETINGVLVERRLSALKETVVKSESDSTTDLDSVRQPPTTQHGPYASFIIPQQQQPSVLSSSASIIPCHN